MALYMVVKLGGWATFSCIQQSRGRCEGAIRRRPRKPATRQIRTLPSTVTISPRRFKAVIHFSEWPFAVSQASKQRQFAADLHAMPNCIAGKYFRECGLLINLLNYNSLF
jgi:hypothetical protein